MKIVQSLFVAALLVITSFISSCHTPFVDQKADAYGEQKGLSAEANMRLSLIQENLETLAKRRSMANARAEARRVGLLNSGQSPSSDSYYNTWDTERRDSEQQAIAHCDEIRTYTAQMSASELRALHRWRDSFEARNGWLSQALRWLV